MKNAPALTLHQAVLDNNISTVTSLLYHQRVNVNTKDSNGNTPLHIAAHRGFKHIIELLFEHSFENYRIEPEDTINVIEINNDGKTAYMIAQDQGHTEVVEFLKPETLFTYISNNDIAHVKMMLDQSIDVHLKDKGLLEACDFFCSTMHNILKKAQLIELLLAHGANVNAKDENGKTPLHMAADRDYRIITRLLLKHGANTAIIDNSGNTARMRAQYNRHYKIAKLLEQYEKKLC